jgi:hypothetical protein
MQPDLFCSLYLSDSLSEHGCHESQSVRSSRVHTISNDTEIKEDTAHDIQEVTEIQA